VSVVLATVIVCCKAARFSKRSAKRGHPMIAGNRTVDTMELIVSSDKNRFDVMRSRNVITTFDFRLSTSPVPLPRLSRVRLANREETPVRCFRIGEIFATRSPDLG
jgi:hypothetical protein